MVGRLLGHGLGGLESMSGDHPKTVTRLLHRLADGDRGAGNELWPVVYEELRGLAQNQMAKEGAKLTLQPTALVNEAWLRFAQLEQFRLQERAQFFLLASKIMRSVLVDAARARKSQKRGGGQKPVPISVDIGVDSDSAIDLLSLDDALQRLEERDENLARIVELRFFGGLSHREVADALNQSLRSVERNWQVARVWLYAQLAED